MGRFLALLGLTAVLASFGTEAHEPMSKSGDWHIYKQAQVQVANTFNDDGAMAGVVCSVAHKSCSAYLLAGIGCDDGGTIPMMISSPVGAFSITTTCTEFPGADKAHPQLMFVINEYSSAKAAFESGGPVGFVLPIPNGQFKTVRFSTVGATAAISDAMTLPASGPQDPPGQVHEMKTSAPAL